MEESGLDKRRTAKKEETFNPLSGKPSFGLCIIPKSPEFEGKACSVKLFAWETSGK
jgi:hypothetical protein